MSLYDLCILLEIKQSKFEFSGKGIIHSKEFITPENHQSLLAVGLFFSSNPESLEFLYSRISKSLTSCVCLPVCLSVCPSHLQFWLKGLVFWLFAKFGPLVYSLFRCVHASLYEGLSVGPSVRPSVGPAFFLNRGIHLKSHRNDRIKF